MPRWYSSKCCLAPVTLPFVSLFYVDAVAMGFFPFAMELLLFKLPWLPCVVSWEWEALPARYSLYVVVVVLRIWLLWLPEFGGGSPWWLQHTWRGAVHLLPCSLHNLKKNTSQGQILSPCVYVYIYPKVSALGSWPSTEGRQPNMKVIHKAIASL